MRSMQKFLLALLIISLFYQGKTTAQEKTKPTKPLISLHGQDDRNLIKNIFDSQKTIVLDKEILFIVESDVKCLIRQFPSDKKVISVVTIRSDDNASGDIVIFGRFYDNPKSFSARRFNSKHIYTLTATENGSCEVFILPYCGNEEDAIVLKFATQIPVPPPAPSPSPPQPPSPPPAPSPTTELVSLLQSALQKDISRNGMKEIEHCQALGKVYESVGKTLVEQNKEMTIGKVYEVAFSASQLAGIPRRDAALQSVRSEIDKWTSKQLEEKIDKNWNEATLLQGEKLKNMGSILQELGLALQKAAEIKK